MKTIDYKGWNPGAINKGEFVLRLKVGECIQCKNVMWCKWGCTEKTYPVGMRDYSHSRWEEVATVYLDTLKADDFDTSDEWTQELIAELDRRGC